MSDLYCYPFNATKCYAAIKNKNSSNTWRQCHNKHRPGQHYCGVHLRAKAPKRYDHMFPHTVPDSDCESVPGVVLPAGAPPVTITVTKAAKTAKTAKKGVKSVKTTTKDIEVPKSKRVCTNKNSVKKLDEFYVRNLPIIVKMQALGRGFLIRQRTNVVNQVDFYTQDELITTPSPYYITLSDKDDITISYGFDLRSLKRLLETSKINPFTTKEFHITSVMRAFRVIKQTEEMGYKCDITPDKMTKEQSFRAYVLQVFQKINMLGNYADDNWFLDLDMGQLKKLYIGAEDIWNYRTQMPPAEKIKVVKSGMLFTQVSKVKEMSAEQHRELAVMIMDEFDRMVSEGVNIDCKKLGAMLALTALTEVSVPAANAMPMYVQQYQEPE